MHHYAWTKTGATIQVHMNGPFVIAGAGSERQLQGGTHTALRAHRLVYPSLAAVHGNSSRIAQLRVRPSILWRVPCRGFPTPASRS